MIFYSQPPTPPPLVLGIQGLSTPEIYMGSHSLKVLKLLEMIVPEMPVHLRRTEDEESGLALTNLAA